MIVKEIEIYSVIPSYECLLSLSKEYHLNKEYK